jgi:energy-coupling factor transporter ATP-binding protein EcfA2
MYISRIEIDNIRGFRHLDFNLEHGAGTSQYAGWTVFTGDNGSGKTALLKAIAIAVNGPALARAFQPSFQRWVREGYKTGSIQVELQVGEEDKFKRTGPPNVRILAAVDINCGTDPKAEPTLKAKPVKKKGPREGPWTENPNGWFSCGYGPFRRLYGESPDAQRMMSGAGPLGRFATLFREDASLIECDRWLRDLKYRSLDRGEEQEDPTLERVRDLLNDKFMPGGMEIEKIDSDGLHLRDQAGLVLPLEHISDGYRAALALLVDIVRHMASVYGPDQLIKHGDDGHVVVDKPGVVLIDEIDSHLHPEWQRQIGFWLRRKFPKIQFLVTTHSPLICQAADAQGIFHLPSPGSNRDPFQLGPEDYMKIVQAKPDKILLTPAFGLRHTRSPKVVDQCKRQADLTAKKDAGLGTESDLAELKKLNHELSPLFAEGL